MKLFVLNTNTYPKHYALTHLVPSGVFASLVRNFFYHNNNSEFYI